MELCDATNYLITNYEMSTCLAVMYIDLHSLKICHCFVFSVVSVCESSQACKIWEVRGCGCKFVN